MNEDMLWCSKPVTNAKAICGPRTLTRGDRVRIREGYYGGGEVYYYDSKGATADGLVLVNDFPANQNDEDNECHWFLADAIEPYPYTREERIERAIEDFDYEMFRVEGRSALTDTTRAILFAILDAGV